MWPQHAAGQATHISLKFSVRGLALDTMLTMSHNDRRQDKLAVTAGTAHGWTPTQLHPRATPAQHSRLVMLHFMIALSKAAATQSRS